MAKMRVEKAELPTIGWALKIPSIDLLSGGNEWSLPIGNARDAADRLRADLNAIAPGICEMPPEPPPLTVAEADRAYVDAVLAKVPAGTDRTALLKQCRRARGL